MAIIKMKCVAKSVEREMLVICGEFYIIPIFIIKNKKWTSPKLTFGKKH